MPEVITKFTGVFAFLSNGYKCPVVFEYIKYPTAEHMIEALKTRDEDLRVEIANTPNISKVRELTKDIELNDKWETGKYEALYLAVKAKFSIDPLKDILEGTGDAILINGTKDDEVMGMVQIPGTSKWKGANALGKVLMRVRDEIKTGEVTSFCNGDIWCSMRKER